MMVLFRIIIIITVVALLWTRDDTVVVVNGFFVPRHGKNKFDIFHQHYRHPPRLLSSNHGTTTTVNSLSSTTTSTTSGDPPSSRTNEENNNNQLHPSPQSNTKLIFQYSPSSLLHLKALDESWSPKKRGGTPTQNSSSSSSSSRSIRQTIIISASALVSAGGYSLAALLTGQTIATADATALLAGLSSGAAAFVALGGSLRLSEDELPKDGGYDATFVVDRPPRISRIVDRIRNSSSHVANSTITLLPSPSNDDPRRRSTLSTATRLVSSIHSSTYLSQFRDAVATAAASDRIGRLNPLVMRTLVDKHTYDAAMDGVADWIDAVDAALDDDSETVRFALTRPPCHHARREGASGGCFLCGPAAAAFYALEQRGVERVAILDVDAHHGNGVADGVQEEGRVRYCSIHENRPDVAGGGRRGGDDDGRRRGPTAEDVGPLGNILNVPLDAGVGWDDGYREAMVEKVVPWLKEGSPDLLIVAAGFDALEADKTSGLRLRVDDFGRMGTLLHEAFGRRVAFGLEGGYCWQNGELPAAVMSFVEAWAKDE